MAGFLQRASRRTLLNDYVFGSNAPALSFLLPAFSSRGPLRIWRCQSTTSEATTPSLASSQEPPPSVAPAAPQASTTSTELSPSSPALPSETTVTNSKESTSTPKPAKPSIFSSLPPLKQYRPKPPISQNDSQIQAYHTSLILQPPWYTTIHIHSRPYLVTLGDRILLPSLLYGPPSPDKNPLNKPLQPGDIIKITHASTLGSRDFTIKGTPYIDPRLFTCRARVLETTSEPLRIKEKTKRRQRRVKTVKSKHRYTVLAICELKVNELPEEFKSVGRAKKMEAVKEAM